MKVLWFAGGIFLVVLVIDSAVRTLMLPRGENAFTTRAVFVGLREVFNRLARLTRTYEGRDRVMALYAPVCLLVLPLVWLLLVMAAFTAMFHALGVRGFERAFEMSGSSMFTLGFVRPPDLATTILAFFEAASGLALLALLIAYLPTIYGAFSRREVLVSQLAVRAGEPPSGVEILARAQRMERFQLLDELWVQWQQWFAEVEETHTSLAVLGFFRSPLSHRSWVTAAGAVLDAASLRLVGRRPALRSASGLLHPRRRLLAACGRRVLRPAVRRGSRAHRRDEHQRGRVPRGVRPSRRGVDPDPRRS